MSVPPVVIGLLLGLAALVVTLTVVYMRRRGGNFSEYSAGVAKWAHSQGLRYAMESEFTRNAEWREEGPFAVGRHRRGRDIVYGMHDRKPIAVFRYGTSDDDGLHPLVACTWMGGDLPLIRVTREVGYADMPGEFVTGVAPFDARYRVTVSGAGVGMAAELFTGNVARFVLSNDDSVGEFWIQNGWLFTAWDSEEFVPSEVLHYVNFLTGLARHVPETVKSSNALGPHGRTVGGDSVRDLFPKVSPFQWR